MMFRKKKGRASFEQVLGAIVVLLDRKKYISKNEIQSQILENAGEIRRIKVGDIEYIVDKEDLDE